MFYLYRFKSEKTYIAHMSVHLSANKSFTCNICGRSYDTEGRLKIHSVTHSNERPYQCLHCKKTFKRNQDLKVSDINTCCYFFSLYLSILIL